MISKYFISLASLAAQAVATIFYAGVAESGGEFGVYSSSAINGTGLPGRFGVDYQFINTATVDIYVDQNKARPASFPVMAVTKHFIVDQPLQSCFPS